MSVIRISVLKATLIFLIFLTGSCFPGRKIETPLEQSQYDNLTTYEKLVSFLSKLDRRSELIQLDTLGYSVKGRMIPYLKISKGKFGEDRTDKFIVLLFAQQHGNEPGGKEALLSLSRDFAEGELTDLLNQMDLLIVPQVNPDGGEVHERFNAGGIDLNRSHLILNGPETIALRELFLEWEPYVTLDMHEYQPIRNNWSRHGFIQFFDVQYGVTTNLNTDIAIREFAENNFLPYAREKITAAGYTFHNYLVGSPDRIRYSTTNINDGREGFGIFNTLSFILEGKNEIVPTNNIKRRREAQQYAVETLLRFCSENKEELISRIREARSNLIINEDNSFVLTMKRSRDNKPLSIPVLEIREKEGDYEFGDTINAEIDNYYPLILPGHQTTIPEAYIVNRDETQIIDLLRTHRIIMRELSEGEVFHGFYYTIDELKTVELEEREIILPVIIKEPALYIANQGDVLIPSGQLGRNLVATALEPQSMHGLIQYDTYSHLRRIGRYPVVPVNIPNLTEIFD